MKGWSPQSAANAYLDTIKLCKENDKTGSSFTPLQTECTEFLSALAAGMNAKLIVETSSEVSSSTIALAAAARQTGGHVVCILPEEPDSTSITESKEVIYKDSELKDIVEFKRGDACELLPSYQNIDFCLIDCKTDDYTRLFKLVDVNPTRSVVVANNLVEGKKGLGDYLRTVKKETAVRSVKHPTGTGMEVTFIGQSDEFDMRDWNGVRSGYRSGGCTPPMDIAAHGRGGGTPPVRRGRRRSGKSKWVVKIDEESGEEHIYRVPSSI